MASYEDIEKLKEEMEATTMVMVTFMRYLKLDPKKLALHFAELDKNRDFAKDLANEVEKVNNKLEKEIGIRSK